MEQNNIDIAQSIKQFGLPCSNDGLMHGNMGTCIFFYHLARKTNNSDYEKIAEDLLDKAFENLSKSASADFESGLAGRGWGIEYLVQNCFVEGETDVILEEVDNAVYRALNEKQYISFELDNGLTGYLFYLIIRLKNKKKTFSLVQCINSELFILIINKIDEMVTLQFNTIVKEIQFDLFWRFPIMLFGLIEAFKLNIYNEKIRNMVRQWVPYFEVYMPSMHINRLFLAVVLKQINSLMPDKKLERLIQILLFATDFEVLKTEIDHNVLNIRYGWPGVILLLNIAKKELPTDWSNHKWIDKTSHAIKERHKNQIKNQILNIPEDGTEQFGLSLGLSGIGLMELLWPEIYLNK